MEDFILSMKSLNEWLVCLLNGIFGFKSIHYHPSTWMQIINAYVDNEIYEIVHLLNIIGFKTIFSCQDFYDNRNSFQIVIHNSRSLLFECFLIRHSILKI